MNYFDYTTRVRYGETDRMGISYYANYFVWFESARTEYFRAIGFIYSEVEASGYFLPVTEAQCRYLAPSSYDDVLVVRTVVSQLKQSSIRFDYQVWKDQAPVFGKETSKPIVTGYTVHVFCSAKTFKPVRVPEALRSKVRLTALPV